MSITDKGLLLLLLAQIYVLYKVTYLEGQQQTIKRLQILLLSKVIPETFKDLTKGDK